MTFVTKMIVHFHRAGGHGFYTGLRLMSGPNEVDPDLWAMTLAECSALQALVDSQENGGVTIEMEFERKPAAQSQKPLSKTMQAALVALLDEKHPHGLPGVSAHTYEALERRELVEYDTYDGEPILRLTSKGREVAKTLKENG